MCFISVKEIDILMCVRIYRSSQDVRQDKTAPTRHALTCENLFIMQFAIRQCNGIGMYSTCKCSMYMHWRHSSSCSYDLFL